MGLKLAPAIFLLLLMPLAAAAPADDVREFNFSVSRVPGLISVSTNINTTNLLPGFEYNYSVMVKWAVPKSALRGINAREVTVYVNVKPAPESRQFYFKDGGINESEHFTALKCVIENNSCSAGSTLTESFPIYYRLDPASNRTSDRILVTGSVVPIADEAIVNETNELLTELFSEPGRLNPILEVKLDTAKEKADEGNYDYALRLISEIFNEMGGVGPESSPTPVPASQTSNSTGSLLIGALAGLVVILLVLLLLKRRGRRRGGFDRLEEEEIRGRDYREERPREPERVEYSPPEKKEESESPVVTRVPDWM
ncbi:Uncharacterised protein [uncultured archaeon]|nr:Uncharacterised protein [uncultured archaeon]